MRSGWRSDRPLTGFYAGLQAVSDFETQILIVSILVVVVRFRKLFELKQREREKVRIRDLSSLSWLVSLGLSQQINFDLIHLNHLPASS